MQDAQEPGKRLLDVAFFASKTDTLPQRDRLSWEQLQQLLGRHKVRASKDGRLFSPVLYEEARTRCNEAVQAVSMACVDLDHCPDWKQKLELLRGWEYLAYTSHSHSSTDPRFRVVLPLESSVRARDWPKAWRGLRILLGGAIDEQCKDVAHMYYLPSHPEGRAGMVVYSPGQWLKPEELLALAPASARATGKKQKAAASARGIFEQAIGQIDEQGRHGAARWLTWTLRCKGFAKSVAEGFCSEFVREAEASGARTGKSRSFTEDEYAKLLEGAFAKTPPLTAYPWTDAGNAERLLAVHGENLRYNVDAGKWLVWTGANWQQDETGEASRLAIGVARELFSIGEQLEQEARNSSLSDPAGAGQAAKDLEQAEDLRRFARKCESRDRLKAALEMASWTSEATPVRAAEMDANQWLLNCSNGTVDLQTGQLQAHQREDLQSIVLPVQYEPGAKCPVFLDFLQAVCGGDSELVLWLQKAIGYSLSGSTREQVFFLLHGGGSNGKSTLLDLVARLLGDYHKKTTATALVEGESDRASNELARLRGARLVTAEETTAGKRLAESLVKSMTGSKVLTARFLYQESFEYSPLFKLWLACNHLPRVDGQDHAIWRRIRIIPFRVTFDEQKPGALPVDRQLPEKLQSELPGILAWAVAGCLRWLAEGLGTCAAVTAATSHYRDTQDVLGEFLQECCITRPEARVFARDLHSAYTAWAVTRGEKPMAKRSLTLRLEERGEFYSVTRDGLKQWQGIGLLPEAPKKGSESGLSAVSAHISGLSSNSDSDLTNRSWKKDTLATLTTPEHEDSEPDEDGEHESGWL